MSPCAVSPKKVKKNPKYKGPYLVELRHSLTLRYLNKIFKTEKVIKCEVMLKSTKLFYHSSFIPLFGSQHPISSAQSQQIRARLQRNVQYVRKAILQ